MHSWKWNDHLQMYNHPNNMLHSFSHAWMTMTGAIFNPAATFSMECRIDEVRLGELKKKNSKPVFTKKKIK